MSLISEIADLNPTRATVVALIIAAVLPPGFLTIFVFGRDLFISLDIFKLTLLAVSISTAYLIIFVTAFVLPEIMYGKNGDLGLISAVASGFFWMNVFFYLFLFLSELSETKPYIKIAAKMIFSAIILSGGYIAQGIFNKLLRWYVKRRNLQKVPESENINPKSDQAPTQPI